jgi:hypothetical protein
MRRVAMCVCMLILTAGAARAQSGAPPADLQTSTTRLLPMSGVLVDDAGQALSGAVTVTFSLYDAADGGQLLWSETQQIKAEASGRYQTYLGMVTPLPQDAFSQEQARWLSVESAGRKLPRMMLVAVPYALRAADAETLGGTPLSSFVTRGPDGRIRTTDGEIDRPLVDGSGTPSQLAKFTGATTVGSSIITETAANRIGIGTTDPTEGGLLESKVTIRGTDGQTALAVSNQVGTPRFALNVNADGSWITYDRALGIYTPGVAQRGGRVGVATTDPTGGGVVDSKLTVRNLDNNTGIAVLNEANARRFALNTLNTGGWQMFDGGGGIWNAGLIQTNGNLGIGAVPTEDRLTVHTAGLSDAAVRATSTNGPALWGVSAITSGAGVLGDNSSEGEAVVGRNNSSFAGAVVGRNNGDYAGVHGFVLGSGYGVLGRGGIGGGTGRGGRFEQINSGSAANALEATTNGTGNTFHANHTGSSGNVAVFQSASANVARIDKTGRGFFNNGTQASGADVAESFEVEGEAATYEPGDVLEISTDRDRTMRRSTTAYSTRVLGVYATKPGVLLTANSIDHDLTGQVPLGVVGVIPTKVTAENGPIRRGDLLVTSMTPGHAMKAGPNPPVGTVIGKALADFAGAGTGRIEVFVNVR